MTNDTAWQESDSVLFIEYGRYFVPERARQLATIWALLPQRPGPLHVYELACGEGLLAEAILEAHAEAVVYGLDGSAAMLRAATTRLARFGARFRPVHFDLATRAWRAPACADAVVSSLTIHHLDGPGKRQLYADLYQMLNPGGTLVVADVVAVCGAEALVYAAAAWDAEVQRQAAAADDGGAAFEVFVQQKWNLFRYPEANALDTPSPLYAQLGWLAEAGFAAVDVYWMLAGHAIFGGRRR